MSKLSPDNQIITNFAQLMLQDSYLLPISLFRRYQELRLNEKELVQLVRVVAPAFHHGTMQLSDVMREFSLDASQAKGLLQSYIDRDLIEYDKKRDCYTCEGLYKELFLLWASDQRPGMAAEELPPEKPQKKAPAAAEKEQIRQISHLYHRFEQEFGQSLKYTESDRLRTWLDEDKIAPELIEEALRRAVLQGKCTFAYIGSILRAWQKKQLYTLEQVLKYDDRPEANAAPAKTKKTSEKDKRSSKFDEIYQRTLKS